MKVEKRDAILSKIDAVVRILIENNNIKFEDFQPIREAITEVEMEVLDLSKNQ